ncbi:MAG TPA: DMT family transporter [Xanthobacteraceae bacterium]|nr:DMT family transporter [Xanthobacteraceae bacterium]
MATAPMDDAAKARLMLVLLSLGWGVTWPIMRIALEEIPPVSMRTGTAFFGAAVLFAYARLSRRNIAILPGVARLHIFVAGLLNIVGFSLFSAFAQLNATTSRVAFLTYTMPIWSCLLARLVLGERMTANRQIALALCIAGLAVLIYPLASHGIPAGLLLATGAGLTWAMGTIYLKWSRMAGDPIGIAAWQVLVGFLVMAGVMFMVDGAPQFWPASVLALACMVFTGTVGSGIAYLLWFEIVRRLPAMTASLGILAAPVIGVLSSMLLLGERPTLADTVGFALIFAAAASVLIQPQQVVPAR